MGLGIPSWAVSAIDAITSAVGGAWKFVKNCMSDLGNCVNKILEMADDAGMNIPTWGKNIVKSLKALRRRRQLGDSYETHVERRRLNPLITGWNFIKNCLGDLGGCASNILVLAEDADVGLPAWGVNIVKSLKAAIGRRRLETDSFKNVMLGFETHDNHQAMRRRLNPLLTGWNFIKDCLTDLNGCASNILSLAKKVKMGLPDWALNVVTALEAVITKGTGGRRLGEVSCSSEEFEPKNLIDQIVCGWNNLIMPCLKNFGECMCKYY